MSTRSFRHPVILTGPPGVGKTSVGKKLSTKCGIPFFDLDQMIEETFRVSIAELFSRKKESYFRVLETQVLEQFSKRPKPAAFVLSVGGGTVLSDKNRRLLKQLGRLIHLDVSGEILVKRLSELEEPHPLIKSRTDIRKLLKGREKYYMSAAVCSIDTNHRSVAQVSNDCLKEFKKWEDETASVH